MLSDGAEGRTEAMKSIVILLLFLLCALLSACNDERKLMRILARNPELRDTVEVEAIVEYVHADTVFVPVEADTVTVTKDRLTVRYVDVPGPTVWLEGECRSDTVKVEVPVFQPTISNDVFPWWGYVLIGLSLIIALLAQLKKS